MVRRRPREKVTGQAANRLARVTFFGSARLTEYHADRRTGTDPTHHSRRDLYAQLVDRHERTVFTLVMRIIGRREEAEEITQDVFLKAFRQLDRFAGRSSFRTWLYRIACNAAISQARRTQPRRAEIDERRLAVLPDEEADRMEEWAAHQEQLDALTHAIGRLDPEERALVTLFYYEERSVAECAEITALSESNVKVRLHRIRKKLYLLVTTQRDETK